MRPCHEIGLLQQSCKCPGWPAHPGTLQAIRFLVKGVGRGGRCQSGVIEYAAVNRVTFAVNAGFCNGDLGAWIRDPASGGTAGTF